MPLVGRYLALIRFSHTLFALPFALISAILAWQHEPFRPLDLMGIILAMIFARSAAMSFNRLVDRHIDAANPRTASRHLPARTLGVTQVWLFWLISSFAFILSTGLFLLRDLPNWWPTILALPVLAWICAYSWAKRFTSLAHYWLGIALALTPLAAWIAIRGMIDLQVPAMLGLAICFWVGGFDILYACQDADFDRATGLNSIPARFGIPRALKMSAFSHALTIGCLVGVWQLSSDVGFVFLGGVGLVGPLLMYEHWLVSPADLSKVNRAFFQVNAIISLGLLLLVMVDVWLMSK